MATAGEIIYASDFPPGTSYQYQQTVVYTATGAFAKASYPGLKAVRVRCVGSGGGSGGCAATAAGEGATSGGGAGGTYAEKFVIVSGDLATSETVTIGVAGTAGSAGNNAGGNGGDTSFGTHCIGNGGTGSAGSAATNTTTGTAGGAASISGSVGDLIISGSAGSDGRHNADGTRVNDATGGASGKGYGGSQSESNTTASAAGTAGLLYGGGASGAHNDPSESAVGGAAGALGIVLVDVYV